MRRNLQQIAVIVILGALLFGLSDRAVVAEEATTEQINELNDDIAEKRARLEQLDSKLEQYTSIIRQKEAQADSLTNELEILDNKIAKLQLDLESTKLEIDATDSEVRLLDLEIAEQSKNLENQKQIIAGVLREMQVETDVSLLELVFGNSNFSALFDELSRLESINSDLRQILTDTRQTRAVLESKRGSKEEKLANLETLERDLARQKSQAEDAQGAKTVLVSETQQSEAQYRALVYELREEQQYIDAQVLTLQRQIEQRILDSDELGDSSLLTWPVTGYRITTLYHDPTYPFRYLFEHSGLDLAIPQGSPVVAAAPGYVAFARTGRMYGNYIMVIHGGGKATLYAHLSQMLVEPDQFVARGEVIAKSGGLPGTAGAGFSTGPHLHFEVRSDGIPVDPFGYLVSL